MTELERRKQRDRFKKWKERAIKKITPLLVIYFKDPQKSDTTRMVGRIVEALHSNYYDILDDKGNHLRPEDVIAKRIFLQMEVEQFCQLMAELTKPQFRPRGLYPMCPHCETRKTKEGDCNCE